MQSSDAARADLADHPRANAGRFAALAVASVLVGCTRPHSVQIAHEAAQATDARVARDASARADGPRDAATSATLAPDDEVRSCSSGLYDQFPCALDVDDVRARRAVETASGCRAELDRSETDDSAAFAIAIGAALLPRWGQEADPRDASTGSPTRACFDVALPSTAGASPTPQIVFMTSQSDRHLVAALRFGGEGAQAARGILGLLRWTEPGQVIAEVVVPTRGELEGIRVREHVVARHRIVEVPGGVLVDDTPADSTGLYSIEGHSLSRVGVFRTGRWRSGSPREDFSGDLHFDETRVFYASRVVTVGEGARSQPLGPGEPGAVETVGEYTFDGHALTLLHGVAASPAGVGGATPDPLEEIAATPLPALAVEASARHVTEVAAVCSAEIHPTPGDDAGEERELRNAVGAALMPPSTWAGRDFRRVGVSVGRGCGGVRFSLGDPSGHPVPQVAIAARLPGGRVLAIAEAFVQGEGACDELHEGVFGILRRTDDGRVVTEAVAPWSNECHVSYALAEHRVGGHRFVEVPGGTTGTGAGDAGGMALYELRGGRLVRVGPREFVVVSNHGGALFPEYYGGLFFDAERVYNHTLTINGPARADEIGEWRRVITRVETVRWSEDGERWHPARERFAGDAGARP